MKRLYHGYAMIISSLPDTLYQEVASTSVVNLGQITRKFNS